MIEVDSKVFAAGEIFDQMLAFMNRGFQFRVGWTDRSCRMFQVEIILEEWKGDNQMFVGRGLTVQHAWDEAKHVIARKVCDGD